MACCLTSVYKLLQIVDSNWFRLQNIFYGNLLSGGRRFNRWNDRKGSRGCLGRVSLTEKVQNEELWKESNHPRTKPSGITCNTHSLRKKDCNKRNFMLQFDSRQADFFDLIFFLSDLGNPHITNGEFGVAKPFPWTVNMRDTKTGIDRQGICRACRHRNVLIGSRGISVKIRHP